MKVIVAGSRNFKDYEYMQEILDTHLVPLVNDDVIISGTANGADQLGERYAQKRSLKCIRMPAEWDKHGRSAGYIRNKEMAEIADMCFVFWNGVSRGSKHMIEIALDKGIPTLVFQGGEG